MRRYCGGTLKAASLYEVQVTTLRRQRDFANFEQPLVGMQD